MKSKLLSDLAKASETYVPSHRPWTSEETEAVKLFYNKVPMNLLTQKLNRTRSAINCKWRELKNL